MWWERKEFFLREKIECLVRERKRKRDNERERKRKRDNERERKKTDTVTESLEKINK